MVEFAIVVGVGQLKGGESIGDELEDAVERVVGVGFELLSVSLFALGVELYAGQDEGLFVVEELIERSFRHIESLANGFHSALNDAFAAEGFFSGFDNELAQLELLWGEVFWPRAGDRGYCGIAFASGGHCFREELEELDRLEGLGELGELGELALRGTEPRLSGRAKKGL